MQKPANVPVSGLTSRPLICTSTQVLHVILQEKARNFLARFSLQTSHVVHLLDPSSLYSNIRSPHRTQSRTCFLQWKLPSRALEAATLHHVVLEKLTRECSGEVEPRLNITGSQAPRRRAETRAFHTGRDHAQSSASCRHSSSQAGFADESVLHCRRLKPTAVEGHGGKTCCACTQSSPVTSRALVRRTAKARLINPQKQWLRAERRDRALFTEVGAA